MRGEVIEMSEERDVKTNGWADPATPGRVPPAPGPRQGGATAVADPKGGAEAPVASAPAKSGPATDQTGRKSDKQLESLTHREVEVLKLLSQGQTNPQIARSLLFSVSTVKAHVRSILNKLDVSDRTQAAVRAIEFKLT